MFYFLLIPLYLLTLTKASDHAIYISVLEIDSQEMKVKVFSNDLEDAVRNDKSNLQEYFQKKIKLRINDKDINFIHKETKEEGDSKWITFKINPPEKWESLDLEAVYFMELFPTQMNIINVRVGKPQHFRLSKQTPSCNFSF